jgi:hypothetical protein
MKFLEATPVQYAVEPHRAFNSWWWTILSAFILILIGGAIWVWIISYDRTFDGRAYPYNKQVVTAYFSVIKFGPLAGAISALIAMIKVRRYWLLASVCLLLIHCGGGALFWVIIIINT